MQPLTLRRVVHAKAPFPEHACLTARTSTVALPCAVGQHRRTDSGLSLWLKNKSLSVEEMRQKTEDSVTDHDHLNAAVVGRRTSASPSIRVCMATPPSKPPVPVPTSSSSLATSSSVDVISTKEKAGGHVDAFARMEGNMRSIEDYVHSRESRIAELERSLRVLDEWVQRRPTTVEDVRLQYKARLARPVYEETLRLIRREIVGALSVEERLYAERITQFWEMYMQIPSELRTREVIMNFYIQFFQLDDSVPEIDSKDLCPLCKGRLFVDRKVSMLQCTAPLCALVIPYLTVRSNVRVMTSKPHLSTSSPENKQWNRFVTSMTPHKEGESPVTPTDLMDVSQWIMKYKHVKTHQPVKTKMVQDAIHALKRPHLIPWATQMAGAINGTIQPKMTADQHDEIVSRLRLVQFLFHFYKTRMENLQLPSPRVVFAQICVVRQWTHLLPLFPVAFDADEQKKLERLLPLLQKVDHRYNWIAAPSPTAHTVHMAYTVRAPISQSEVGTTTVSTASSAASATAVVLPLQQQRSFAPAAVTAIPTANATLTSTATPLPLQQQRCFPFGPNNTLEAAAPVAMVMA